MVRARMQAHTNTLARRHAHSTTITEIIVGIRNGIGLLLRDEAEAGAHKFSIV
jgi:hypothetical protein